MPTETAGHDTVAEKGLQQVISFLQEVSERSGDYASKLKAILQSSRKAKAA